MSKIASLGIREEIKNILDSGGFFRDVQQYLQMKFPHKFQEFHGEVFVDIAKLAAFDVIHQRS